MFPKLYKSDEINFTHNGLGLLTGSITAVATEEMNGMFELRIEYDSEGFLVDEIKEEMIIKAKANDKQDEQLFRIYSITKNHENDNLIIDAQHITYDLANNFVESLNAHNLTKRQVMELIGSSTVLPHPFNLTSSNTTTRSSTKLYRTNPLQMVGGIEGSVLQIWGGQIERDNFNLILHDRRGSDDGVKVTYEKNITGLEATFDISGLVTRIFPFVYIEGTDDEPSRLITVNGKYIDSPLINNYEKIYIKPIDYSHDERIDIQDRTDAQIRQQLTNIANQYFNETGTDKIKVDMDVRFEHLWETEEYKHLAVLELVGMGDTVTIEHSRLKVNATAIVNYIRYDCIAEKNEEVRLGSVKARLTDSVNRVVDVAEKAEQAQQTANQAIKTANGKNTIYYGPDEPTNGIEGDLWFKVVDGEYTRTYRHDGIQWQLVLSVDVRDAIDEAQQAKDEAQQAVDRANQATQQATDAINQAQTAFDEAQQALGTASNAYDIATSLQGDVTNLSTSVDEHTGQISSITQSVTGLQTQVSDIEGNVSTLTQTVSSLTTRIGDAEGNISVLQQTSSSLAARLTDAEGNITTLTATVSGLQTTVSNVQGDVSSVTQLANALQTRMTNAEGDISTLTQTASSLQSTVSSLQDEWDNLEIGGRNLIVRHNEIKGKLLGVDGTTRNSSYDNLMRDYIPVKPGEEFIFSQEKVVENDGFRTNYFRYTFFDEPIDDVEHVIDRGANNSDSFKVVVPDGANWLRVSYYADNNVKLEKGNKATDWTPAPEDMATQSQITQLSDNINLRVAKNDIINQINVSTESILIAGRKVHITGQTTIDNGVIKSAHIQSLDAGKITTGTLDAALVSVINLSANSIVGGILQSQNENITFDLNRSEFIVRGGGQFIFQDSGNGIKYIRNNHSAGMIMANSSNASTPLVAIGTDTGNGVINANSPDFNGIMIQAKELNRHMQFITSSSIFATRTDLSTGAIIVKTDGSTGGRGIFPQRAGTYNYDLGTGANYWNDFYIKGDIKNQGVTTIRDNTGVGGWRIETRADSGSTTITLRGINTNQRNYNLGKSGYRINRIYLSNSPDVSSDERLKTDISNNTLGLDFIRDVNTVNYRLNKLPCDVGNLKQNGVIAQQLLPVLVKHGVDVNDTMLVRLNDDGHYSVAYEQFIAPLIKSVQELDTKLTNNVEFLKLKVQYLEQKIEQLEAS